MLADNFKSKILKYDKSNIPIVTLKKLELYIQSKHFDQESLIKQELGTQAILASWLISLVAFSKSQNLREPVIIVEDSSNEHPSYIKNMNSPKKIAREIADQMSSRSPQLSDRLIELQKNGAGKDEIEEYQRFELIRQSIQDVKRNAIANQVARVSPQKLYSGVKSKVAGNMKAQKSGRNLTMMKESQSFGIKAPAYTMSRDAPTKSPMKGTSSMNQSVLVAGIKKTPSKVSHARVTPMKMSASKTSMGWSASKISSNMSASKNSNIPAFKPMSVMSNSKPISNQSATKPAQATQSVSKPKLIAPKSQRKSASKAYLQTISSQLKNSQMSMSKSSAKIPTKTPHKFPKKAPRVEEVNFLGPEDLTADETERPKSAAKSVAKSADKSSFKIQSSPKKSPRKSSPVKDSPIKMTQAQLTEDIQQSAYISRTLDPDTARQLARELYVDQNVNVVSPDRKIRPG
jgi:hypothetical protein